MRLLFQMVDQKALWDDTSGQNIMIFLPQYFLEDNFSNDSIPGRLYLNEVPLDVRSAEELHTLQKLDEAIIKYENEPDLSFKKAVEVFRVNQINSFREIRNLGLAYDIAFLLYEIVAFVNSALYLEIAEKFSNQRF